MKKSVKKQTKRNTKSNARRKPKKQTNNAYVKIINFLATSCYVGYLPKAPGTWGSLFTVALFWLVFRHLNFSYFLWFILLIFAAGVFISGEYNRLHGQKDAPEAVIDEVLGQSIALLPVVWLFYTIKRIEPEMLTLYIVHLHFLLGTLISFGLFRFFDILKPLGIKQVEKLPGGWGVMLDDVLAAVYAFIVFMLLAFIFWYTTLVVYIVN